MRKPAADSIQAKVDAANRLRINYPIPEGLEKLTKAEETAWKQYTSAKTPWKSQELRALHKIVKHETICLKMAKESAKSDTMTSNRFGDPIVNPIHAEARAAQKLLLSMTQAAGLNIPYKDKVDVPNAPTGSTRGKKVQLLR